MASLAVVLRHRVLTLLVTLGTLVTTVWLYMIVPKGFLPAQDTGVIAASFEAGPTSSFDEMVRLQALIARELEADNAVQSVVSIVGVSKVNSTPNSGHFKIVLRARASRDPLDVVVARLARAGSGLPGVKLYLQPVQEVQIATRTSRAQYQFSLIGSEQAEVNRWALALTERLAEGDILRDVTNDVQAGGLRALVKVDREMAGRLGVSMASVNDALNDAFGQRQISTIFGQSNQYRVVLESLPEYQSDPNSLSRVFVPGSGGAQVPLSVIARIERIAAPLAVNHEQQFPSATLSFNVAPGASLGEAVEAIRAARADLGVPELITGSYSGDAAEFAKSLASQPALILAAIITIYIVLGVLYESYIHPITILTTLPSAGIGAVLALMLTGLDLSLIALIGIVLLMGIVKKNAIMMIDFALDAERTRGLSPEQSIVEAARLRFRPIMMTTLAALFGALPLALENGVGSELRYPLGVTIIGGLLLSQVLTLYTTPVIYLWLDGLGRRRAPAPAMATIAPHSAIGPASPPKRAEAAE